MTASVTTAIRNVIPMGAGRRGTPAGTFRDTADVIRTLAPNHPVYCFSREALERQVARFLQDFPGTPAYAVKANAEPLVVRAVAEAGIRCFDVASISEIALVREVAPGATLLYDNPVKSRAEIEEAYGVFGVRSFALDDEPELHKIRSVIGEDPGVQLTVRFKLPRVSKSQDLTSKFGATREEAVRLLSQVKAAGYRPALTFHPGSQCREPEAYAEYLEAAAAIAAAADVESGTVNVGGGFPAPYLDAVVPPLDEYFRVIREAFAAHFDAERWELVCEPGRALVAGSTSLLTRVKHRRRGNVIFLNDGIYGGLLEQFMFKVRMPARVFRNDRLLQGARRDFEIFGPTCDATDRLPLPQPLPAEIAEGDWVEFGLMGAYGSVTATRFNGFASERYVEVENGFPAVTG